MFQQPAQVLYMICFYMIGEKGKKAEKDFMHILMQEQLMKMQKQIKSVNEFP